jgi:hypothetical protein
LLLVRDDVSFSIGSESGPAGESVAANRRWLVDHRLLDPTAGDIIFSGRAFIPARQARSSGRIRWSSAPPTV